MADIFISYSSENRQQTADLAMDGVQGAHSSRSHVTFEAALAERTQNMLDLCTRCGLCVEACPSVDAAGLRGEDSHAIISGVIDGLRTGIGSEASATWAAACTLSGECIKACTYGVNPRFVLAMARATWLKAAHSQSERRRSGLDLYRASSRDVGVLSKLQADAAALERLGQRASAPASSDAPPDFIFYSGCNVLKTPHIALLALDIMDLLGTSYKVLGGPSHCCGILQMRAGDLEMAGRMGAATVEKLSHSKTGTVLSWCPSCYVQFTETTLPGIHQQRAGRPFEMLPFLRYLGDNIEALRPHMRHPVPLRVAMHRHPGLPAVMDAAAQLLRAVPGLTLLHLDTPAAGLQSANLSVLPEQRRALELAQLEAAETAAVDALVTVYHSDHRSLCAHERDWPFQIVNLLEVLGRSMGLGHRDSYKELKILQDADLILEACSDAISEHALDPEQARRVIVDALLGEQPLPLKPQDGG